MHPMIRAFPSAEFYDNKLEDDVSISEREKPAILTEVTKEIKVSPTVFFDLKFSKENSAQTSKKNDQEA